ncbi:MAG: hypothetical protein KatS3mg008_1113 [Acidimicrobiales bacterium]|nr:MAG: hypothetical protein KatS3mg008_1113 [Acidimicrobiales bacterium]
MKISASDSRIRLGDRPVAHATHRLARISAFKVRPVLDLIRGKSVTEAAEILSLTERRGAVLVDKVLRSAVANAVNNHEMGEPEELFVAACWADEGPTLRRWRPRARGRATRIRKRTCHITLVVARYTPEELEAMRRRLEQRVGRARRSSTEERRRRVEKSRIRQASGASERGANDAGDEHREKPEHPQDQQTTAGEAPTPDNSTIEEHSVDERVEEERVEGATTDRRKDEGGRSEESEGD